MATKNETKQIIQSFRTIKAYLENSSFDSSTIPQEDTIPIKELKEEYILYSERNDEKIHIFYEIHKNTFSKKDLTTLISKISDTIGKKDSIIIIVKEYTRDSIRNLLKNEFSQYYIQLFILNQLQFNILEHSFVPKHIKLTPDEKKELFQKFNISKDKQLPQISQFDPVACALFLKPGEICKIIRYDKLSLQNEYYRVCVP
tara:strand:+ start:155 stop:757 length:603 start_codon:yes stop_codon:yes gene_type:complete